MVVREVGRAATSIRLLEARWLTLSGYADRPTRRGGGFSRSCAAATLETDFRGTLPASYNPVYLPGQSTSQPGEAGRDEGRQAFTADTWRRLAPIAGPAPKQSRHPGRLHVVQHDGAHETQAVLMTDAEVVNWLTDPTDNES
ncbi:hypothetical protein [Streptomyces cellulosae]|uniref:DUF397 domain-containing protein n=1 Tax=Streptomyces cellulosae TaxID=1968 RepID=A0ABW7YHE7_STRCE